AAGSAMASDRMGPGAEIPPEAGPPDPEIEPARVPSQKAKGAVMICAAREKRSRACMPAKLGRKPERGCGGGHRRAAKAARDVTGTGPGRIFQIGRASCRERGERVVAGRERGTK